MNDIDAYDKKILGILDINARMSASKISKLVKLSKEGVIYRIRRLIEKNYIKNFYTIMNAALFGYSYYKVFFGFQKLGSQKEKQIVDFLKKSDNCINVRVADGKSQIIFLTANKNRVELKNFLESFSQKFGQFLLKKSVHTVTAGYKLNYFQGESGYKKFYSGEPSSFTLDETEKKILAAMAIDARIKTVELARLLGIDVRKAQYMLRKLEENKIIVGYSSALNISVLPRHLVVMNFRLNNTSKAPSIIEYFCKTSSGLFAYELLGDYDLSIELYVENEAALQKNLKGFREKFLDHYISYDTHHVFDEHNRAWLPLSLKEITGHGDSTHARGGKKPIITKNLISIKYI